MLSSPHREMTKKGHVKDVSQIIVGNCLNSPVMSLIQKPIENRTDFAMSFVWTDPRTYILVLLKSVRSIHMEFIAILGT